MGRADERRARQAQGRRAAPKRSAGHESASAGTGGTAGGKARRTGIRRFLNWKTSSARSSACACSAWAPSSCSTWSSPCPPGNAAAQPQSNIYKYSDGKVLARTGKVNREIVDLSKVPKERPADVRRRREQVLLQRLRRRPQGHRPRPGQHPRRQGQAGRFDDHPAVRQELLPEPGPDRHPQAEGNGHLAEGRPPASKDEILAGYINTSYYGRDAYGIQAAAQAYYGVDAEPTSASRRAPTSPRCSRRPASTTGRSPRTPASGWCRTAGTTPSTTWSSRAGSTPASGRP